MVSEHKDKDKIIAIKVNGIIKDLNTEIHNSDKTEFIKIDSKEGLEILRHSTSHLLAQAVKQLFPHIKIAIGPAIEDGFYYDFDKEAPFTPENLKKIEERMNENARKDQKFERFEAGKADALKKFANEPYKKELIEEIHDEKISIYKHSDFEDFCRGPHVPSTKYIKGFKLMKVAGAYWRGDATKKQLQRIYGISFPTKEELKAHLKMLEEAEKRDHRKLGKQLELFSAHDEAPGMPFFHNKGNIIYNELVKFMTEEMRKLNYELIKTPMILNKVLWLQSGHWDHYKENMYFTKIDEQDFAVKPMNCPGGMLVYKNKTHSYKELPIKAGEFGMVHRHELSGVLSGLFRVRVFTQDDAHIFCMPEQLVEQLLELIELIDKIYKKFDFKYRVELSTKPEDSMGDPKLWENAEHALESALKEKQLNYTVCPGAGAFYGPKIDFKIKDAIGREWQCGTVQVDFQMPERFELEYIGEDNTAHRPVMIHRTIYGSLERFIGVLIEHFAGKFPLWLVPVQARILTVADRFNEHAAGIKKKMQDAGIRVDVDFKAESIPKKVREAQMQKIPLIITIGEKEEANNTLAVRTLDGKVKFGVKVDEFISAVKENVEKREIKFDV